jgi:hypothetical protein
MFAVIAALVFATAFILAMGTIAFMFVTYHEKMVAALLYEPVPDTMTVYRLEVTRPRIRPAMTLQPIPVRTALAA